MRLRIASILLPVAFAGAAVFAVAAPAQAATPYCSGVTTVTKGSTYARYPSDGPNLSCLIINGNVGEDVKALQRGLNRCYSAGLAVDGIFGTNTFNALRRAQDRAGVTPDGKYGPNTARAINFPYFSSSSDAFVRCGHL